MPGMTASALRPQSCSACCPRLVSGRCWARHSPILLRLGIPRAEVHLVVDDSVACHARALAASASELSARTPRSWGDLAAYSLDPDGHMVAFASSL